MTLWPFPHHTGGGRPTLFAPGEREAFTAFFLQGLERCRSADGDTLRVSYR